MLVLNKALWNFNNSLVVVKSVEPNMCLSHLNFDFSPFWIQLHDLSSNWKKSTIILKIVKKLGKVVKLNQVFIINGLTKFIRARIYFDLTCLNYWCSN